MRLYLAGPMTGHPNHNIPLFDSVTRLLREQGLDIVSPAELDNPETRVVAASAEDGHMPKDWPDTWGDFLSRDVKLVADEVDGVVVLPEWWTSKGARLEAFCAWLTKKPVYYATDVLLLGFDRARPILPLYVERGCGGHIPHGPKGFLYETCEDLKRRLKEPAYA